MYRDGCASWVRVHSSIFCCLFTFTLISVHLNGCICDRLVHVILYSCHRYRLPGFWRPQHVLTWLLCLEMILKWMYKDYVTRWLPAANIPISLFPAHQYFIFPEQAWFFWFTIALIDFTSQRQRTKSAHINIADSSHHVISRPLKFYLKAKMKNKLTWDIDICDL